MLKRVKRWGHSLVIVFNKEERNIIGLSEGDIIEIEIKHIERNDGTKNPD